MTPARRVATGVLLAAFPLVACGGSFTETSTQDAGNTAPTATPPSPAGGNATASEAVSDSSAVLLNSADYCGAVVTGLYKQLLGRAPDPVGLQGWTERLKKPTPLQQIVLGFCDSAEYKEKNPPPDQFVESLYTRLLRRPSDPAGKAAWVNMLDSGQSTALVVNGFLQSQEYCTQRVTELYQTLLARQPDPVGLVGWVNAMSGGTPFQQIQLGFLTSGEYRARTLARL